LPESRSCTRLPRVISRNGMTHDRVVPLFQEDSPRKPEVIYVRPAFFQCIPSIERQYVLLDRSIRRRGVKPPSLLGDAKPQHGGQKLAWVRNIDQEAKRTVHETACERILDQTWHPASPTRVLHVRLRSYLSQDTVNPRPRPKTPRSETVSGTGRSELARFTGERAKTSD